MKYLSIFPQTLFFFAVPFFASLSFHIVTEAEFNAYASVYSHYLFHIFKINL